VSNNKCCLFDLFLRSGIDVGHEYVSIVFCFLCFIDVDLSF